MFFIPTIVNIGGIKVNSPDHGSAVSFGFNCLVGIRVSGKKNQGYGQQMADCTKVAVPISIILDDEFLDSPSIKETIL
ncbi:hypothetical protein [Neobacillus ginsengisoli]|uniref:Uncharacterized protein n=1 Tax=Neobacillus ginsengisoli TaxID=904295 RepID=A0ABT9XX23_9BACI|nr:hypothetical protein [Neobacillus ginsengisoli]MDQ0200125.1 hypothetical protein [Neobacillus ginsengisoli]